MDTGSADGVSFPAVAARPVVCPGCDTPLSGDRRAAGYCPSCGEAWTRCPTCEGAVSPLWRNCPVDGRALVPTSVVTAVGGLKFASREPHRILLSDVRHPPAPHGGYFWAVSRATTLLRVAPADKAAPVVKRDRPEYGDGPFAIVQDGPSSRPLIAVVGTRRVALADPAAPGEGPFKVHSETLPSPRELRDERGQPARNHFFVPSPGDRFGLPRTGGFPAIAFRDRTIAVLKRQQDVESLVLWRPGEPMKSYELTEQDLTGPFAIVDRVCAYSARRFYWLDGDEVRTVDYPSDFRPVVSVNEFTPLELPVGRPPFVVADHVAFLPGRIAGRPGFLSVGWDGRAPTFRPIVTSGGESFQRAAGDALLVAGGGRVRLAERSTFSQTLLEASALAPGPTLVHGKQIVVCCQSFGGRELRVYGDGSERVAMPPGCTPLDLFLLPGFLVLTAAVQSGVEILSWPLA